MSEQPEFKAVREQQGRAYRKVYGQMKKQEFAGKLSMQWTEDNVLHISIKWTYTSLDREDREIILVQVAEFLRSKGYDAEFVPVRQRNELVTISAYVSVVFADL